MDFTRRGDFTWRVLTVWKVVKWYFCKNKRQILLIGNVILHNTNPKPELIPELTRTNGFVEVLILGKGNFGMGNDYRWIETES